MYLRLSAVFVLCLSLVCRGDESGEKGGILMDGVAAHVNNHVVTISEALALAAPEHRKLAQKYTGKELEKRLYESYREAVNAVIERYLVLDAYAEQDATLPGWVIDRRVEDIVTDNFGGDRAKLMEALEADGVTFEEWRKQMLDRIIVSSMNSAHVMENAMVSPGSAKEEYERNRDKYSTPEKVQFKLIEKGKSSEQEMRDLLKRLKDGEDFGALAKEFSSGNNASDGGLWDWVEPKMLRRELVDALEKLKEGEISGVVEADDELYIVKLEKRQEPGVLSFSQVQNEIERNLRSQEAERLYAAWIERLKENAYVKLFDVDLF